jgi:protein TonB
MFEAFQTAPGGVDSRRRLAASTTAAVGVYAVLVALAFVVGRSVVAPDVERVVEVAFEKVKPKPIPPPPPPPKVIPRRPKVIPPPLAVAPPPAPRPLEAPKEIPKEAPPEAVPGTGPAPAAIDDGSSNGVAGGVRGGTGAVQVAPVGPAAPVNLPEEAIPPVPSADNATPTYPEVARTAGKEGMVILKIVITAEGRVTNIRVLKGESPFVEKAIAAVQTHTYKPALLDGRPIAVYRILKIPFRLSIGG